MATKGKGKKQDKKPVWENRIIGEGVVKAADLKANPLNFRTHGMAQQQALSGALERLGWIQRVVINKRTGNLIDGHLRASLAIRKGADVPAVFVDLSEQEERLALASLDPIAAMAGQDDATLSKLLEGLVGDNVRVDAYLNAMRSSIPGVNLPKQGNTGEDDVPPTPVNVRTTRGETWRLRDHVLHIGDATDVATVGRAMDGSAADAVWTDPPYNVAYEGSDGQTIANDDMEAGAFFRFLVDLLKAACQHTKPGGAVYIAHADSAGLVFRQAAAEAGWSIRQALVWVKNAFTVGRQDYQWQHEPILYGWRPGAAHRWYGFRNKSTVLDDRRDVSMMTEAEVRQALQDLREAIDGTIIDANKPKRNDIPPTMKPVELIRRMLVNSTAPGERVLDVCAGSGSTLIACETVGRICHAVELDERYADAIIMRWEQFTGETATRADGATFASLTPHKINNENA